MSTVVTIVNGSMTYLAAPDVETLRTALATGKVVDEATGIGLDTVALRVDQAGAQGRVNQGGFFAVAGMVDWSVQDKRRTF